MTVDLTGGATGCVLTGHDALYAYPADMQTNGTLIGNTGADTGLPRVTLADAATERIKWVWAIPVDWAALRVRFATVPEVAGGGNVVFTFAYKWITLEEGDVDTAVDATLTPSPVAVSSTQFDYLYHTSVIDTITVSLGGFGDAPFMLCSLTRLGSDGSDTLSGGVSIPLVTVTRLDVA